jgi:hypothetical protein
MIFTLSLFGPRGGNARPHTTGSPRREQAKDHLPAVAPGSPWLGVMLPYTPLHHLLAADFAGPLVMITGILVVYNAIERGGPVQGIATLPEALWELSLSIYCIVKGFRPTSPILLTDTVMLPDPDSALRREA